VLAVWSAWEIENSSGPTSSHAWVARVGRLVIYSTERCSCCDHRCSKPGVAGSSPAGRANICGFPSQSAHSDFIGFRRNPNAPWVVQQARQLSWALAGRSEPIRFLIRDRDQKFTDRFEHVFRSEGIEVVRTPFRAPQANGVAERFVRTARSECFDRLLILNQQHLERVLQAFLDHYNGHRPHRALSLTPPEARRPTPMPSASGNARILRRDRLGGVVHEYVRAA